MSTATLPVLDFSQFAAGTAKQQQAFVADLGQALAEVGFFALDHSPVDPKLIQAAYEAAAAFFALPDAVKQGYEQPELHGQRGFVPLGREHAKDYPVPDLKEFWHVGRDPHPELPHLPANLWPEEVPQFQTTMQALYQQLDDCAVVLLEACALYLDQPRQLLRHQVQGGDTILRVIHYPPVPQTAAAHSLRAAPHEDINAITLLCTATGPGLEVQQRDGSWLPVIAQPGQIIVDTGDMLQNLSNGIFKSTTHRVVTPLEEDEPSGLSPGDRSRFSLPFFVHPRPETDLSPRPNCIARSGGVPRYPNLTAGQYLQQRLAEIGLKS